MRILLAALAALVLHAGAAAQSPAPQPVLRVIQILGEKIPLATPPGPNASMEVLGVPQLKPAFAQELRDFLGEPLNADTVSRLVAAVNGELRRSGGDFVVASVPDQDASTGVLKIRVLPGRVGEVRVEGARHFPPSAYTGALRLRRGDLVNLETLGEDTAWLARSNSFRSAEVVAQAGATPGSTDLVLEVREQDPFAASVSLDNTGTRTTGEERVGLSLDWGNAFGLGHVAGYRLSASPNFRNMVAHSLSYSMPLEWRHILSVSANYAKVKGRLPAPLDLEGTNSGASLRYAIPLRLSGTYVDTFTLGADYKRADNNLLFSKAPVNNTLTEVVQFLAGYNGLLRDSMGQTAFSATGTYSPGRLASENDDAAFGRARALASAKYSYVTASVDRLTNLPGGFDWTISGRVQLADGNLLGSEQLAAGGFASVRGIFESAAFGDQGWLLRNELNSPPLRLDFPATLRGSLFWDAARVRNRNLLPGEQAASELQSVGVGVRAAIKDQLNLRADLGFPVRQTQAGRHQNGPRLHLGAVLSF